jgi:hypothetical protein
VKSIPTTSLCNRIKIFSYLREHLGIIYLWKYSYLMHSFWSFCQDSPMLSANLNKICIVISWKVAFLTFCIADAAELASEIAYLQLVNLLASDNTLSLVWLPACPAWQDQYCLLAKSMIMLCKVLIDWLTNWTYVIFLSCNMLPVQSKTCSETL